MRFIVFSDLHLHNYKRFSKGQSRLDNCTQALRDILDYAHEHDINNVLFCGDLFDTPKALNTVVINRAIEVFSEAFEKNPILKFIAISGNHDHASKNLLGSPAESALTCLSNAFPRFLLIDDTFIATDCGRIHGIPYYEYPEHFYQALDTARKSLSKKLNILLIHQSPMGIKNLHIPADIDISDSRFSSFDIVLTGHIHWRESLADNFACGHAT